MPVFSLKFGLTHRPNCPFPVAVGQRQTCLHAYRSAHSLAISSISRTASSSPASVASFRAIANCSRASIAKFAAKSLSARPKRLVCVGSPPNDALCTNASRYSRMASVSSGTKSASDSVRNGSPFPELSCRSYSARNASSASDATDSSTLSIGFAHGCAIRVTKSKTS